MRRATSSAGGCWSRKAKCQVPRFKVPHHRRTSEDRRALERYGDGAGVDVVTILVLGEVHPIVEEMDQSVGIPLVGSLVSPQRTCGLTPGQIAGTGGLPTPRRDFGRGV